MQIDLNNGQFRRDGKSCSSCCNNFLTRKDNKYMAIHRGVSHHMNDIEQLAMLQHQWLTLLEELLSYKMS